LADTGPNRAPKRILILYSFDNEQGIYTGFDRALRSNFGPGPRPGGLYTEYLDWCGSLPEHTADLVRLLKLKFSEHKPDLVVPVSYQQSVSAGRRRRTIPGYADRLIQCAADGGSETGFGQETWGPTSREGQYR
jgi:hypothetical protein